jgi:cytochrome c heme-lyase
MGANASTEVGKSDLTQRMAQNNLTPSLESSSSSSSTTTPTNTTTMSECPVPKESRNLNSPIFAMMKGASSASGDNKDGSVVTCPVTGKESKKAILASAANASTSANNNKKKDKGPIYNVYGQVIDPANKMPPPNQEPTPGQTIPLSKERVQSTIPKGGTDTTWLYPSPQMFWNSLHRKGKADGVVETDVNTVILIHNEMNERTWKQLLSWESLHTSEHQPGEPALRHFMGNPYKLSPKARMKSWVGCGFPFDRHDWYVDRGGKERHYIIDYYFNSNGEAVASPTETSTPSFDKEAKMTRQIYVDVRPAIEDFTSLIDRLRLFPERTLAALSRPRFTADGIDPSKQTAEVTAAAAAAPAYSSAQHSDAGIDWKKLDDKCKPLLDALKNAKTEEERRSRHIALNYAMGRELCPVEAKSFMIELEKTGGSATDEERAFSLMTTCVEKKVTADRPAKLN